MDQRTRVANDNLGEAFSLCHAGPNSHRPGSWLRSGPRCGTRGSGAAPRVAETASDSSHTTSENPHGLQPLMRIRVLACRLTVGQFANCPTVSEGGRDADGKQRAGPDPSAEGQAAADAGEAGLRGYGEPKRSVDSRRQLPDADDFPSPAPELAGDAFIAGRVGLAFAVPEGAVGFRAGGALAAVMPIASAVRRQIARARWI
jgi:hypothetical protein